MMAICIVLITCLWNDPCLKKRRNKKGVVVCRSIFAGAAMLEVTALSQTNDENTQCNSIVFNEAL